MKRINIYFFIFIILIVLFLLTLRIIAGSGASYIDIINGRFTLELQEPKNYLYYETTQEFHGDGTVFIIMDYSNLENFEKLSSNFQYEKSYSSQDELKSYLKTQYGTGELNAKVYDDYLNKIVTNDFVCMENHIKENQMFFIYNPKIQEGMLIISYS